jgi:hypothetical protein
VIIAFAFFVEWEHASSSDVFAATRLLGDSGPFRNAWLANHWTSAMKSKGRLEDKLTFYLSERLEDKLAFYLSNSESGCFNLWDWVTLGLDIVHVNNMVSNGTCLRTLLRVDGCSLSGIR